MSAEFSQPHDQSYDYESELRGLRPDYPGEGTGTLEPDFEFTPYEERPDYDIADRHTMTESVPTRLRESVPTRTREAAMGSAAIGTRAVGDTPWAARAETSGMEQVERSSEVVEGTLVGDKVPNYHAERLATERRVNVVGDYAEEVDAETYQLIMARVANLNQEPGRSVVVVANFGPGATTQLIDRATENQGVYDLRAASVQGVPDLLTSEQFGDTLASAAAEGESPTVASRYGQLLGPAIAAIEEWKGGPKPNGTGSVGPLEARDAIRLLGGASPEDPLGDRTRGVAHKNQVPNLPELGLRRMVRDSVGKTSLSSNEAYILPLRDFLDKSYPDSGTQHFAGMPEYPQGLGAEAAPIPIPGQESVTSIIHLGVSGSGRRLDYHSAIIANALPPLIAEQTPSGRPELVVLVNPDLAPKQAIMQIFRHCNSQQIPMIVTVGNLTEETAWLIQSGAYVWTQVDSTKAALLSKAMGTTVRTRASGATISSGTNTGFSVHKGSSVNYEGTHGDYAQGSGTSGSIDGSQGDNYGLQVNFERGPQARFDAHDIEEQVGPSQVGAVTSSKEPLGISAISGELLRTFPPPVEDPPELAEIKAQMQRVQANSAEMLRLQGRLAVYQQLAARQENERQAISGPVPAQIGTSSEIPQGARPRVTPVAARTPALQVREWRAARANEVVHGRYRGSLAKYIRDIYNAECERNGVEPTKEGYRIWVKPYERHID